MTYTPAAVGSSSGALTVTTNASPATATVALSGASPETISVVANTAAGAAGWALPGTPGSPNAWLQLGGALSVSGRTLPGIEARTPSDQRERPGLKVMSHWPLWMLAALALLAGLAFALRRRRSHWAALVFGAALLLAACGTPPATLNPSAGSTPAGNYVLTVTATAAGGSRTAQLPFTVR